jgi:ATP-dependent helicase/nuclease subunit A
MQDPQRIAADPTISAFVTANAGSGKTKTLIDRVARLLLARVKPEAILCVTYTKAAAAEMQRRLFERLGKWSVTSDADLRAELVKLVGEPDATPGRLTTPAFVGSPRPVRPGPGDARRPEDPDHPRLLRKAAAALPAGGRGLARLHGDGRPGRRRHRPRRSSLHRRLGRQPSGRLFAEAYARFSVALDFSASRRCSPASRPGAARSWPMSRAAAASEAVDDAWSRCGFDAPTSAADLAAQAVAGLDLGAWRAAATALFDGGGKQDAKYAEALAAVARDPDATLDLALRALFTEGGEGTPATWPGKTSGLKSREDLREALKTEQIKLEAARERVRAAKVAEDTADALRLAVLYVTSHQIEKDARGALDFTDLIDKTRVLLTEKVEAAWVLYKLDGGVDHILLDEAQDTAPEQWEILSALTADFFAGATGRAGTVGAPSGPCSWSATRSSRSIRSRAPIRSGC